ncbi:MAG: MgtC/SapB family protein [Hyphomicrobium sp.]
MTTIDLFQRLALALAIGLLIGLERGWKMREEAEGERSAGFRTHALSGLLGGIWGAVAALKGDSGTLALAIAFATFTSAMTLFQYRETAEEGRHDATTLVASMLAFALGAFAVLGDMAAAAACGVAVTALLALKQALHSWVRRLTWEELRSVLVLASMTFVLLPLLPNRTIDPWGALNPFEIWLRTILIAAISFAGDVAIKVFGATSGIALTGIAGGLVSSTAVTVNMAELAKMHRGRTSVFAGGALLSSATMMARVFAVVAVLNTALLAKLGLPLALAGATLAGAGLFLLGQQQETADDGNAIVLGNPLDLASVLKFGALLTVIIVLSKVVTGVAGNMGAYVLAAVSGVADVDAITMSMARLGAGPLGLDVAARAIAIVVAANTIAKTVIGWIGGGAAFGLRMALAAGAAFAAGGLGFVAGAWM